MDRAASASESPTGASTAPERPLSEELGDLLVDDGTPTTVSRLVDRLSIRGHALPALFFCLPFIQPLPMAGLSAPFGLGICVLGVLMMLGKPVWVPRRWREREIPPRLLERLVHAGQRLLRAAEKIVRPRGAWFHDGPWARRIAGFIIAVSGVKMALPLPLPFTNALPAAVIAVASIGVLEEDALVIGIAAAMFLIVSAIFAGILLIPFIGLAWLGF